MSDITIHINICTDNDAFNHAENVELIRIVQNAVQFVNAKDNIRRKLFDANGNRVGQIKTFVDKEYEYDR
tara:strand:+ start:465 stop:674 length:210 start_codon:yes stop_codon:yes gene_type:complete